MKRILLILIGCLLASLSFADSVFMEGFEYANQDLTAPIGWTCDDQSWLCGYHDKDHNRTAHSGDWYAFTNANDSWMFMQTYQSNELRYRYTYWAISDGSYEVEFWAGEGPTAEQMTQLLFTANVSSGSYEEFSAYIETITSVHQYFGIHAIAAEGAYHLSIDDINIDMVNKYDLVVTPIRFDTVMYPGTPITIQYDVANKGFEDLIVTMTPYTDFFTDIQFTVDGSDNNTFPTVPEQNVHCTCTATLSPNLAPGTLCWMDIMFTVSCDCLTRMATLWVTTSDSNEVSEHDNEEDVIQVEVYDLTGKRVDPLNLSTGIYIERKITSHRISTRKLVKN